MRIKIWHIFLTDKTIAVVLPVAVRAIVARRNPTVLALALPYRQRAE